MNTLPTLNRAGRSIADRAVTGLGFARHPMISRAGNRFTLVDGAGNQRPMALMDQAGRIYIDVVIFDASPHPNRMFFSGPYDGAEGTPPDCLSDNGTGPSTQSRHPQAPTCAVCPQAVWGSKVTPQGNEIPACQVGKKLAALVVGDESGLAYELRIPPGSFSGKPTTDPQEGGWTWYIKALKGHGAELFDCVTRITFVPNTMGLLVFKPVAQLTPDLIQRVNDAWDKNVAEELCGLTDKAIDPAAFGQRPSLAGTAGAPPPVNQVPQQFMPPPPPPPQQQAFIPAPAAPPANMAAGLPEGTPKRKRRTKEEIAAENAAKQPAPFVSGMQQVAPTGPAMVEDESIPPFLRRAAPAAPATPPAPQNFGLATPQPMDPSLQAKLNEAFKLPS